MAKKLTPGQRSLMVSVDILQETDMSLAWWQLDDSDKRRARNLSRAGLVTEKTNAHHRRGLALTESGRQALAAGGER